MLPIRLAELTWFYLVAFLIMPQYTVIVIGVIRYFDTPPSLEPQHSTNNQCEKYYNTWLRARLPSFVPCCVHFDREFSCESP